MSSWNFVTSSLVALCAGGLFQLNILCGLVQGIIAQSEELKLQSEALQKEARELLRACQDYYPDAENAYEVSTHATLLKAMAFHKECWEMRSESYIICLLVE